MALSLTIRNDVIRFVLRDMVPDRAWRGSRPLDWFSSQFDFVSDLALRKHLAEAYYQARFSEKLRAALGLKGRFNSTFIKPQLLLYASIYEALIDYYLEQCSGNPVVQKLLSSDTFTLASNAFAKGTELVSVTASGTEQLFPCRRKNRTQKVKEIQFRERLRTAESLGAVPADMVGMIEQLYTSRNRIHLSAAASEDFTPDASESAQAFRELSRFLKHLRGWVSTLG